ncbi:MAG TPA: NAD(P)/FAD-dependent oxidoreductase [Gemmatimonadaceae bacterium]|jgi:thioredoxin reductase|nr:NAD(P)/FAD-dependent oxidoreductase [Gemmatimonadaceae bacterium]
MATQQQYDIGIVGGGPAGLSAAIWSARYLHSVLLVDSGDPRNWETRGINGFLGAEGIRPPELRTRGRELCRNLGVELVDAIVLRVEQTSDEEFAICLEGGGRRVVRRLLLAIGVRDVWPDIPGLDHVYGANAHVCPDCDGYEARGKKVVVIGNGRRAVGMALNLTTWTNDIIICTNGRPPELDEPEYCEKLDALNIPVLTQPIAKVCREGSSIHCLMLADGMQLDTDKVFFTIGQYPADDLGVQLGCERDDEGHIIIDMHCHTSVINVFAAGDVTPGPQLAITAAADGATAALSMHKSLVPESRKLTPREPELTTTSR